MRGKIRIGEESRRKKGKKEGKGGGKGEGLERRGKDWKGRGLEKMRGKGGRTRRTEGKEMKDGKESRGREEGVERRRKEREREAEKLAFGQHCLTAQRTDEDSYRAKDTEIRCDNATK